MSTHDDRGETEESDRIRHTNPNPTSVGPASHQELIKFLGSNTYTEIRQPQGSPNVKNPDAFRIVVNDRACETQDPRCRLGHDLKNCLNIIMGFSELLSKKVAVDQDAARYLDNIVTTVGRMVDMINNSRCRVAMPPLGELDTPRLEPTDPTPDT